MNETNLQDGSPAEGAAALSEGDVEAVVTPAADETVETPKPDAPEGTEARGAQKRIDELTWKWREEQRRNADLMRRLTDRDEPQREAPTKASTPDDIGPPPVAPTLDSVGWDEAKLREEQAQYQTAYAEWTRAAVRAEAKAMLDERERGDTDRKRVSTFRERETEFAAKTPDYRDLVYSETVSISKDMAEIIADSHDGPALAYHLARNPDKAREIAALPPLQAARELGRIEATLTAAAAPPPPRPRPTSAPPPPPRIEAITPESTVRTTDSSGDVLGDAEWFALERKRIAKSRLKRNG